MTSTSPSARTRRHISIPATRTRPTGSSSAILRSSGDENDNDDTYSSGDDDDFILAQSSKKAPPTSTTPRIPKVLHDSDDDLSSSDEDDEFLKRIARSSPTFSRKKKHAQKPPPPPRVSLGDSHQKKTAVKSRRGNLSDSDDDDDLLQDSICGDNDDASSSSVETAELVRRLNKKRMGSPCPTKMDSGNCVNEHGAGYDEELLHPSTNRALKGGEEEEEEEEVDSLVEPKNDDSDEEKSVDTTELTRRLKAKFGPPNGSSPSQESSSVPNEIAATNQSPALSTSPASRQRFAGPRDDGVASWMKDDDQKEDFLFEPAEEESSSSEGEDSTDTTELTRRLKKNLCPPAPTTNPFHDRESSVQSPSSLRRSFHEDASDNDVTPPPQRRQEDVTTDRTTDNLYEDLDVDDDDDDDDQSADTAELTRRLRAKLCPSEPSASTDIAPVVPTEIGADTNPNEDLSRGRQLQEESVQFRLPSQSDSSSDDDSEGDEEEGDDQSQNEQQSCPPAEKQLAQGMVLTTQRASMETDPRPKTTVSKPPQRPQGPPSPGQLKPPPPQRADVPAAAAPSTTHSNINPYLQKSRHSLPPSHSTNPYTKNVPRKLPARPQGHETNNQRNERDSAHQHVLSPQKNHHHDHWSEPNRQLHHNHHGQESSLSENVARRLDQFYPEESSSPPDMYQAAFGSSPLPPRDALATHDHARPPRRPAPGPTYEDAFGSSPPRYQEDSFVNHAHNSWRLAHSSTAVLDRNHHQPARISENHREARTEEDLYSEAFGGPDGRHEASNTNTNDDDCVVLVDSDSDDYGGSPQTHQTRAQQAPTVHTGLRTAQRSPRFNIVSRAFPKRQHSAAFVRDQPASDIEDYSDEDDYDQTYRPTEKVARRVTDDHAVRLRQQRPRRSTTIGNTTATAILVDDSFNAAATTMGESANPKGASGLLRPWKRSQKPRLRDAVASNPFNVASAAPRQRMQQQQRPAIPSGPSRFGSTSLAEQRHRIQTQRNDIHGGSGVGAGGFAYADNRKQNEESDDDSIEEEQTAPAPRRRATRKPAARKTATKGRKRGRSGGAKKTTSKKKKSGGKRGGGWSGGGRGRGRRGGSGGRGSWGGQNRNADGGGGGGVWGDGNEGGWQVSENFTREDPAMQHVGGAEIVF